MFFTVLMCFFCKMNPGILCINHDSCMEWKYESRILHQFISSPFPAAQCIWMAQSENF